MVHIQAQSQTVSRFLVGHWGAVPGPILLVPILQSYFCPFLFLLTEYASAALVTVLREKKKGQKIVTRSKNSSPIAHHCVFGIGHTAIYTYWRVFEVGQVLHLACLDHWLQQELESWRDHVSVAARTHRFAVYAHTHAGYWHRKAKDCRKWKKGAVAMGVHCFLHATQHYTRWTSKSFNVLKMYVYTFNWHT